MPYYNVTFPYCGGTLHRHLTDFYQYSLDEFDVVEKLQTSTSIVIKTQFERGLDIFKSLIDELCRAQKTLNIPSKCQAKHTRTTYRGLFAFLKCLWETLDIDNLNVSNSDVRWTKIANLLINLYTVFFDIQTGAEIEEDY